MKKTVLYSCITLFLLCLLPGYVSAALVVKGDYVFDYNGGAYGQVWIRNMDLFTNFTAYEQILSVSRYTQTPTDAEIGAWHIASEPDFSNLMANSAEDVYTAFSGADWFASMAPFDRTVLSGRVLPDSGFNHYDFGVYRSESRYETPSTVEYSFFQILNSSRISFTVSPPTIDGSYAADNYGAWVVADLEITNTPIPGSALLLGSGLLAFARRLRHSRRIEK